MAKYLTEYGTVVESDKPKPEWEPTKEAVTTRAQPAAADAPLDIGGTVRAFGDAATTGAARALLSPLTALGAVGEATGLVKKNPLTLEGVIGGLDAPTDRQQAQSDALAAAHPIASGAGSVVGTIAGAAPTLALGGAVAGGATRALGGGVAARLAGAAAGGATEGASYGLAGASDQARVEHQTLDGEHALAAAGMGALFGGSLSLAGKAAGEVFAAGGRAVKPGLEAFADKSPALVGKAIAEKGDVIADKVVGKGLKLAGLSHGIPGYLAGEVAGEAVAPAVSRFIEQNSGRLGAIAQRGARAAASAIDGAMALGESAQPTFKLAGAGATKTALDVFQGPHDTPEKAYTERVAELQSLGANQGEGVRDAVANMFGPAAHGQEAAVVSATQTAQRGLDYLMGKIPSAGVAIDSLTPLTDRPVPDRVELSNFGRIYAAVMQPSTVLRDIRSGMVTKDQLDAVKAVYPTWFQSNILDALGPKLRARDVDGRRLLPPEAHVLNLLLGIDTGADSAAFGARYGDAFAKAGQPSQSQSATATGSGRKLGQSKYAESFATPSTTDLGG